MIFVRVVFVNLSEIILILVVRVSVRYTIISQNEFPKEIRFFTPKSNVYSCVDRISSVNDSCKKKRCASVQADEMRLLARRNNATLCERKPCELMPEKAMRLCAEESDAPLCESKPCALMPEEAIRLGVRGSNASLCERKRCASVLNI